MNKSWQTVVSEMRAVLQTVEAHHGPQDMPSELTTSLCGSVKAVASFPVSNIGQLAEKMNILIEQYGIEDFGSGGEAQYVYDDIRRLANRAKASPEWLSSLNAYNAAREAERAWDAETISPHFLGIEPENVTKWRAASEPITPAMWAESERLMDVRCQAEEALIACPSPDAAAFALKYLIAHSDGRETDCWDEVLEAEARLFSGRAG